MKLKPTLRLQDAERIVDVALTEGRKADLLPLTVIVLDAGGNIIATKSDIELIIGARGTDCRETRTFSIVGYQNDNSLREL